MGAGFDLPEAARKRLARMRGAEGKAGIFTSDLSVSEFVLVKQAGFTPLGLVMGSSVYHVGYQMIFAGFFGLFWKDKELDVATQATYTARELAMTRMEEEARALGADGIVGVRFQLPKYDWGKELLHVVAMGTAIRHIGDGENFRAPGNRPFTSTLSGQDFSTLLRSGHRPVSLAMGNCIYAVRPQGIIQNIKQLGKNAEVPGYTQAIYASRELAQERMLADVASKNADGVVGVELEETLHEHTDDHGNLLYYTLDYFSTGTAVTPMGNRTDIESPSLVLEMADAVQAPRFPTANPMREDDSEDSEDS